MKLSDSLKNSLKLAYNTNFVNEEVYLKLLQNCFSVLTGGSEVHSITTLYNSKPDVIKELYTALLTVCAECARYDLNADATRQFLANECHFPQNRANTFSDLYNANKRDLQMQLSQIGSHPPHITDIEWKIDYIIKSSAADQLSGPIFRISLIADVYDQQDGRKKVERINFSCNSQELQDFVYKLKEAVTHVQKLGADH